MSIKKRVISICMAAATVASMIGTGAVTANAAAPLYGDVNDDGRVDDMDIARLQQYLSHWNVTINKTNADVNVDGCIDNEDLAKLQQYISGWDVKLGPKRKTGKVELRLVDEYNLNKSLHGAEFTIYVDVNKNGRYDNKDVQYEIIRDNGYCLYQSSDLSVGTYFIKETKAPDRYVCDCAYYKFEIQKDGEVVNITNSSHSLFVNSKNSGSLHIDLVDENNRNKKLNKAEFTIYRDVNENGRRDSYDTIVARSINYSNGTYVVNNLPYGSYLVRETKAPDGYQADTHYYSLTIRSNGRYIIANTHDRSNLFINTPDKFHI